MNGRNSNFELLRIVAMLLIVASHFSTHGALGAFGGNAGYGINGYFSQVLACGGKLGVDVFILISSYFLAAAPVRLSSLAVLWLTTVFWGGLSVLAFGGVSEIGHSEVMAAFLPIIRENYWFVTGYFVLALFSPFLAIQLRALGERRLRWMIVVSLVFYSVFPMLTSASKHYTHFGFSPMIWFFILFAMATYVRHHVDLARIPRRRIVLCLSLGVLFVLGWVLVNDMVMRPGRTKWRWQTVREMNSPAVVVISLGALLLAARAKLWRNAFVNRVAASTFGIYLIHDNPVFRKILWQRLLDVRGHAHDAGFIPWAILTVIAVFAACSALEIGRALLFRPLVTRLRRLLTSVDDRIAVTFDFATEKSKCDGERGT